MRFTTLCLAMALMPSIALGQDKTQVAPTNSSQPTASAPTAQAPAAPAPAEAAKPRVYLQSQSKGSNRNAERDQSMEMSKDFEEVCPAVRITISQQMADYTVLLNHIEMGLLVRDNQFQLADKNGDLLSKTKEGGSIKGGVKKVCDLILADWAKNGKGQTQRANAETPAPAAMTDQSAQPAPVQAAAAELVINSAPDGADIEIDGGFVGDTPSSIETSAGDHVVVIHKKGFKDWQRKVKVSGGSITLRAELDPAQ